MVSPYIVSAFGDTLDPRPKLINKVYRTEDGSAVDKLRETIVHTAGGSINEANAPATEHVSSTAASSNVDATATPVDANDE